MINFREFARKTSVLHSFYRRLHKLYVRDPLDLRDTEQIFTEIYKRNKWKGKESVSGTGSDTYQTRVIVKELPNVFGNFGIATLLDIPCGDFYWMKGISLEGIEYTGADIVDDLVKKNVQRHGGPEVSFRVLNLINDALPKVDLVICRDCLVHLSFADIFRSLNNLCDSESGYFLTTTFTGRTENRDIRTGQFRVLNLEIDPFNLPPPLMSINEGCTEGNGAFSDKSLGLWEIADIKALLHDNKILSKSMDA